MCSLLVGQPCLGNLPSKRVYLDQRWNQSLLLWIKQWKKLNGFAISLKDISRWSKPVPAICIHCDSQSAIVRAQSNMYNGKSRHIRRRHNSIRQLLSNGVVSLDYVKSKGNIADPLTKGLNRVLVETSSKGMGLRPLEVTGIETQPS